jgi:hypothetical protein
MHQQEQPEGAGGTPTLREVAADLGAGEVAIASAALALRAEPDLSPAEALTLAMSETRELDAEVGNPFAVLVAQAHGKGAVLALITYVREQQWTVEQLELAVMQLPD